MFLCYLHLQKFLLLHYRLVKLLKETYGHDNVAARADQISVRLEENSALINTNTKVKALSQYCASY
jgi:hypothetical protein